MVDQRRVGGACLLLLLWVVTARVDTQTVQTSSDAAPVLGAVSVRPTTAPGPIRIRANPARVDINSASLIDLISTAYGEPTPIPPYRITGATPWMQDERFDVQATIPEGAAPLNPRLTLLALRRVLADRFKVRTRVESVEGAVYLLVRVPNPQQTANRLVPTKASCDAVDRPAASAPSLPCDAIRIKGGQRFVMDGTGVALAQLAGQLSAIPAISRTVIDRSGLTGRYDFTLEWVPRSTPGADTAAQDTPRESGPSVTAALEEQLGLRLESSRAPVEVLVIESAERPAPN